MITDNCTNLRVVELTLFEGPGNLALVLCLFQGCRQCEELILHEFGHNRRDVRYIAKYPSCLKRITFPEWRGSSTTSRGYWCDVSAWTLSKLVNAATIDRVKHCLILRASFENGSALLAGRLNNLYQQCGGVEQLSISCADLGNDGYVVPLDYDEFGKLS